MVFRAKTQVTTVGSKSPDFSWLKELTADFQLDLKGDPRSFAFQRKTGVEFWDFAFAFYGKQ